MATEPAPHSTSAVSPTQESSIETALPPTPAVTAHPAIPERRRLTLEFPQQMRAGDSDIVRLTLEVDDLGNITPTAVVGGNVITGGAIEIPNLYESHHVVAEARFDIAGVEVTPSELASQTLLQGQSVTFFWSILPQKVAVYRGTVWLHLRFVDKISGDESRRAVSAQIVEIEALNLLGLSGGSVRWVGAIGSVIGSIIGFPFLEDIVRFFFARRKKRRKWG